MPRGRNPTTQKKGEKERVRAGPPSPLAEKIRSLLSSKSTRRAIVFSILALSVLMVILALYMAPNQAEKLERLQEQRLRSDKSFTQPRPKGRVGRAGAGRGNTGGGTAGGKIGELGGLKMQDGKITVDPNGGGAASLEELLQGMSADELNAMLQAAYQQENSGNAASSEAEGEEGGEENVIDHRDYDIGATEELLMED
ncbi:hypothetical protein BT69DRAFT_1300354 [Atractiella rhizophila]|nr:hypothetical protein BT69DRAFT_1300354 [Atractiella rhizophila]